MASTIRARSVRNAVSWAALAYALAAYSTAWAQAPIATSISDQSAQTVTSPVSATEHAETPDASVAEVVVTGTHIQGVQPSSPVISVTQQQIIDSGQTDLGEFARTLPESFSGGLNPGVAVGAQGQTNQAGTGGSSFNLRGLGPDATLTLVNGRRLAYDFFTQGIDVSQIPLAAVDRVQVVLDGSSAVYGSDAVGGVANIILKPDFDGLTATARYGGTTDGGGEQQQYSLTGGKRWATGGIMLAYNYEEDDGIMSNQRSYTSYMPNPSTLYPPITSTGVILTGHQDLSNMIHVSVDAGYNRRTFEDTLNVPPSELIPNSSIDRSYFISPTINVDLPHSWNIALNGVDSSDHAYNTTKIYYAGSKISDSTICYCNGMQSAEVDGNGPLFGLPGGDLKAALGVGYRRETFTSSSIQGSLESKYFFGEFDAPLISPAQSVPGAYRLNVNVAFRYEDYSSMGGTTVPKFGFIWSPVQDLEFKASWGKSFKAPTLNQLYQNSYVYLQSAPAFGATSVPGNATLLETYGGNPSLKPEEATTFTAGPILHPSAIPGLRLELSYFHIDYTNRVLQPITSTTTALSSPNFTQFITARDPSAALQEGLISAVPAASFLDEAGAPYNPANVVAILNNVYQNVARQTYDGVDASASYKTGFAGGSLTASGSASWLEGTQQDSKTSATFSTVGTIFNPPHWRARAGLNWGREGLNLSATMNYIGGEVDTSSTPSRDVASQTTTDIAIGYKLSNADGLLHDVSFLLSVSNLFDAKPPYLRPIAQYLVDYDSTNYSAMGRLVSLSLSKHF